MDDIDAIALLHEPVRQMLYRYVVGAGRPVGRDEAAAHAGVGRGLAAFHLDRLAAAGLLAVTFGRLTGRTGPGAGRPSKLYVRGPREVVVTLPDRRYDVAAMLFATALERQPGSGWSAVLDQTARETGRAIGAAARDAAAGDIAPGALRSAFLATLEHRGYQPLAEPDAIMLGNCPFAGLVDDHRPLVCGMNLALVDGMLDGLGAGDVAASAAPRPGRCCVAIDWPAGAGTSGPGRADA